MEFRIYGPNDDGSMLHVATLDAVNADKAVDSFCNKFGVNNHGFIALAPEQSLSETRFSDKLKFSINGVDYDYE